MVNPSDRARAEGVMPDEVDEVCESEFCLRNTLYLLNEREILKLRAEYYGRIIDD